MFKLVSYFSYDYKCQLYYQHTIQLPTPTATTYRPGYLTAPDFNRTGVCGHGGHRCVIAYAIYGDNYLRYLTGAFRNAEDVTIYYPGWVVRFYHDSTGVVNMRDYLWMCCDYFSDCETDLSNILGGDNHLLLIQFYWFITYPLGYV